MTDAMLTPTLNETVNEKDVTWSVKLRLCSEDGFQQQSQQILALYL